MRLKFPIRLSAAAALPAGCTPPVDLGPGGVVTLTVVLETPSAPAGTALIPDPMVLARDAVGQPVPEVAIRVAAEGGGRPSDTLIVTGPEGTATVAWYLGPRDRGSVSGIQIEAHWEGVRDTEEARSRFAAALGVAVSRFLAQFPASARPDLRNSRSGG